MADDGSVKELVPPGEPLPLRNNMDNPVAPVSKEPKLKCGYTIGLRTDGTFSFEVIGTDPGLVELIGLHQLAGERIYSATDKQCGGKFSVIINHLTNILQQIKPKT